MTRSKTEKVRKLLEANPNIKTEQVMAKLGVAKSYAYVLMSKARKALADDHAQKSEVKQRYAKLIHEVSQGKAKIRMQGSRPENWQTIAVTSSGQSILAGGPTEEELNADSVNHPPHYKIGGIETIDFIEAKSLGFHLGNVVKYVTRADHKGSKLEDLRKAQWYLTRAIERAKV
jgi:hypothetical protein